MCRISRAAPDCENAFSNASAARTCPAPAEADRIKTLLNMCKELTRMLKWLENAGTRWTKRRITRIRIPVIRRRTTPPPLRANLDVDLNGRLSIVRLDVTDGRVFTLLTAKVSDSPAPRGQKRNLFRVV